MERLFCCFCFGQRGGANDTSSASSPMHDLVGQPQAVDQELEDQISHWQQAIFDYENMEIEFMIQHQHSQKQRSVLLDLRSRPETFVGHSDPTVRSLAKKRAEILQMEESFTPKQQTESPSASAKDTMSYFTERLSQIWTTRLHSLDNTQSGPTMMMSQQQMVRGRESTEVFVRPKWPDFLSDVSYDVIKINKYGHQMRRILKLTQNHVISIKNGSEVTKFYHYLDVRRVGLRGGDLLHVLLRSGKKNLYMSPMAPHILQQISTRVQVRRSLDSAFFAPPQSEEEQDFDVASTAELIKFISEENASDAEAIITTFATSLRERTIRSISTNESGVQVLTPASTTSSLLVASKEAEATRRTEEAVDRKEEGPDPVAALPTSSAIRNELEAASKRTPTLGLGCFKEGSPEHAVQEEVRETIFSSTTVEGNTLRLFVEKMRCSPPSFAQLSVEVRNFVDGMHEHMLFTRAFSLAIVYQQHLQRMLADDPSTAQTPSLLSRSLDPVLRTAEVRQLFQKKASLKLLSENNLGLSDVDESLLTVLSYIIFIVVEEAAFLSLKDLLLSLAKQGQDDDKENILVQKMQHLAHRSQRQWGIADNHVSPLGWRSATFELSAMEHNLTPSFQLQVLTRTVMAIYSEFKHVVLPRIQGNAESRGQQVFLGADDLVPIFLFVFCQSSLRHPVRHREMMWALCHPDQLHGEAGYYLTVYESAIEFVSQESIEQDCFLGATGRPRRDEAHSIAASTRPSQRQTSSEYVSFYSFVSGLFKVSGVIIDHDDLSLSMRESFN